MSDKMAEAMNDLLKVLPVVQDGVVGLTRQALAARTPQYDANTRRRALVQLIDDNIVETVWHKGQPRWRQLGNANNR